MEKNQAEHNFARFFRNRMSTHFRSVRNGKLSLALTALCVCVCLLVSVFIGYGKLNHSLHVPHLDYLWWIVATYRKSRATATIYTCKLWIKLYRGENGNYTIHCWESNFGHLLKKWMKHLRWFGRARSLACTYSRHNGRKRYYKRGCDVIERKSCSETYIHASEKKKKKS